MAEYINRAKLEFDFEQCNGRNSKWTPQRVSQMIQRQSAEDVAPVRHGHDTGRCRIFQCSECGYGVIDIYQEDEHNYPVGEFNYCPNCGAKMDLEV